MSLWLVKLAAVILATSCAEILLPSGKIKSSCRTVLALVCISVMIEPIAKLADFDMDFTEVFGNIQTDSAYVENTNEYYKRLLGAEIEAFLEDKGVKATRCNVEGKIENGKFGIEKIFIKIDNSVISGEDEHILDIEKIEKMLSEALGIDEERVKVYG